MFASFVVAPSTKLSAAAQTDDDAAIRVLVRSYRDAVEAKNLNRLVALHALDPQIARKQLQQEWGEAFASPATISTQLAILKLGLTKDRALVHRWFRAYTKKAAQESQTIVSGIRDVLVEKKDGRWLFSGRSWVGYDLLYEIEEQLRDAREDREHPAPSVLHLVAGLQGGAWVPLRMMWWSGEMIPASVVGEGDSESSFRGRLYEQFDSLYQRGTPGYVHLLFQRCPRGWRWIGTMWHPRPPLDSGVERQRALEPQAREARQHTDDNFGDPKAHIDLAATLSAQGLFIEATNEYEKAEALQTNAVPEGVLLVTRKLRDNDPKTQSQRIVNLEKQLGVPADHPTRFIAQLTREQRQSPTALTATLLGLEGSKWGEDRLALEQLNIANALAQRSLLGAVDPLDLRKILGHLRQRVALSTLKPNGRLRSDRFFVRFNVGDENVLPLLVALEGAQHAIYSTFGIAMSGTEVILFGSQPEFRSYKARALGERTSEYEVGETVAELYPTRNSLYILSQEVITFPHGDEMIKTVQHEYAHVAVMRLSRGRDVPDWINEGLACAIEGGHGNYQENCRRMLRANALIPMSELLQWRFQGTRAVFAYDEANSIIDFIIRTSGARALMNVFDGIGRGLNPSIAFRQALGADEVTVFNSWMRDLAQQR